MFKCFTGIIIVLSFIWSKKKRIPNMDTMSSSSTNLMSNMSSVNTADIFNVSNMSNEGKQKIFT